MSDPRYPESESPLSALDIWRTVLAIWLIAGFLLPNTFCRITSAAPLLPTYEQGLTSPVQIVLTLIAGALAFVFSRPRSGGRLPLAVWGLLGLYLGMLGLPIVQSVVTGHAGSEYAEECRCIFSTLCAGLLSAQLFPRLRCAFMALVALASAQSVLALFYFLIGSGTIRSGNIVRAGGTFHQPVHLYFLLCVALPIAITLASERERPRRWIWTIASALMAGTLLFTFNRGGALAAGIGLTWLANRLFSSRITTFGMSTLAVLLAAVTWVARVSDPASVASSERSTNSRLFLWEKALDLIQGHWLYGVGPSGVRLPIQLGHGAGQVTIDFHHPNNLILYTLAQFGLPLGAVFLGGCLLAFSRLWKTWGIEGGCLTAIWIIVFVAGLFDTPFGIWDRPSGNILAGLLAGLTLRRLAYGRQTPGGEEDLSFSDAAEETPWEGAGEDLAEEPGDRS